MAGTMTKAISVFMWFRSIKPKKDEITTHVYEVEKASVKPSEKVAKKANATNSERKLPNTGMNSSSTTALGLSLIALVGLAVRRKLSE